VEKKSTITGIATPKGNSALAILRISGPEAFTLIEKCIREKEKFKTKKAWKISRYTFINPKDKKAIDDITAIKYECPRSYTGENMVEIMCHGGVVVTEKIMGALLEIGMEIAQRGEFTRRA
jgi:tRNA modification GTPase